MAFRILIVGFLLAMVFALATILLVPKPLYAHGTGLTFTATTSDYIVDVDYDSFTVAADLSGRFTLRLFHDAARAKPVDFTQVWVRIVRVGDFQGDDVVFSGWIAKGLFGSTGFSTSISHVGAYELSVRYNDGDTELVEATLPFEVVPAIRDDSFFKTDRNFWFGFGFGALLILALACTSFLIRRRR